MPSKVWDKIIYPFPTFNSSAVIYNFFKVKLTFEMLTVRGQQHSFSTHERVFLGKCQSFWDRKCLDLRGTRTPNLWIHAECSNLLSYQGQTFAVPCCWILVLAVEGGILDTVFVLNPLWPEQNHCHFADGLFNVFFNGDLWILIKISLKFVSKGPVGN